jgi:hypothetical protein
MMAMQRWKSHPTPSVVQLLWFGFLVLCRQKERGHDSAKLPNEINIKEE